MVSRGFLSVQKTGCWAAAWVVALLLVSGWAQQPADFIRYAPELTESLPLIQATEAHQLGYTGKGVGVAVIDIFTPNPSDPCATSHGLWIEGLIRGVAPDAEIKRFGVDTAPTQAGNRACYAMDNADIRSALQSLVSNHERWGIEVVNLSWGGGRHTRSCNGERDVISRLIKSLVAEGVTVIAASGNDGWSDAMIWPACMPETISVGASFDYDGQFLERTAHCAQTPAVDAITCYSNTAAFLDVVAPGSRASVSERLSGLGTSASAAYVSGVVALMLQAKADLSPDQVRGNLAATGVSLKDGRNGLSFSRVNALGAVRAGLPDIKQRPETPPLQKGDINQDGEVSEQDALLLLTALGELLSLSDAQHELADVALPCNANPNWDDYYRLKAMATGNAEPDCVDENASTPAGDLTQPLQVTAALAHPSADGLRFLLQGQGIASGFVSVLDLTGRRLFQSAIQPGHALHSRPASWDGRPVANGVYLIVWDVSGVDGQRQRSVRKIAVIR